MADRTSYVPDLDELTVRQRADELERLLGRLGLERPPLLGNSMGCQVLVDLAARRPHRVGPLILVGPTTDPGRRTFAQQALALLRDWLSELALTPVAVRDYAAFGPLRFLRAARLLLEDRPEDKLPHVQAPVLVVRGERDGLVGRAWAQEAARLAPHGRFVEVPRCAHAVNYTAPEALARLTLDFLQEVE
ncbi:MAG: alpha/beta hydrolase [Thermoleophilia bacterium]|nr:alpha/beta hydrolase [Thermoleophilia bacterium]